MKGGLYVCSTFLRKSQVGVVQSTGEAGSRLFVLVGDDHLILSGVGKFLQTRKIHNMTIVFGYNIMIFIQS